MDINNDDKAEKVYNKLRGAFICPDGHTHRVKYRALRCLRYVFSYKQRCYYRQWCWRQCELYMHRSLGECVYVGLPDLSPLEHDTVLTNFTVKGVHVVLQGNLVARGAEAVMYQSFNHFIPLSDLLDLNIQEIRRKIVHVLLQLRREKAQMRKKAVHVEAVMGGLLTKLQAAAAWMERSLTNDKHSSVCLCNTCI